MALTPVPSINLDNLPKEAMSLIETLVQRAQEADRLEQENRLLREMLRLERLKRYGPKSEKLSEEQVELLELEPGVHAQEVEKESGVSSGRKRLIKREHARRNALPDHLPRREEIIAVEGEERLCVCCGEERCPIGYEEKEVLDMEPARYFVRVIKREKLACRRCPEGGVVTAAAGGPKIVEKGKLSDAVVVDVLIKKYLSHLPLYRGGRMRTRRRIPAVPRANRAQVVSVLSFCRFVRIPQSNTHCDDHQQVTGCLGILVETMPQPSIAHD